MLVWIVENRDEFREHLVKAFSEHDCEVKTWENAYAPITELKKRTAPKPSIIVLCEEPIGLSLRRFLDKFYNLHITKEILLVASTDEFNANLREVSRRQGIHGWVNPTKPGQIKQMLESLKTGSVSQNQNQNRPNTNFDVKLGRLGFQRSEGRVICRGILALTANFDRLLNVIPEEWDTVRLNWRYLQCVNSDGLRLWSSFVSSDFAKDKNFIFESCPLSLYELYLLMPTYFGKNTTIESICLPLTSELRYEVARVFRNSLDSISKVVDDNLQYVYTLSSDCRDLPSEKFEESLTELFYEPAITTPLSRYLPLLHASIRMMLTECFITRETTLDQVSRISGRFTGIIDASEYLGVYISDELPLRDALIGAIREVYRPPLTLLIATERLLQCLRIKFSHRTPLAQSYPESLEYLFEKFEGPIFGRVTKGATSLRLFDYEARYHSDPSERNLDLLLMAGFRTSGLIMEILSPQISTAGIKVFNIIQESTTVANQISPQRLLGHRKENEKLTPASHRTLRSLGLLEYGEAETYGDLIKELVEMSNGHENEIASIMQTLTAHDVMTQWSQHRLIEIRRMSNQIDEKSLLDLLKRNAVTTLEKKLACYYYPELAPDIEASHATLEMEFF
ncbi:MAG: hypothetical protein VYA34_09145 [Myxococcota bacterium]|nr:hypothetical protein [Myxococcota bacterium]